MNDILKNITAIRKNKRINQVEIASYLAMDASNYGRIERGFTELTFTKLAKIAEMFNMRPIDLITYPDKYVKFEKEEKRRRVMVEIELTEEEYKQFFLKIKEG